MGIIILTPGAPSAPSAGILVARSAGGGVSPESPPEAPAVVSMWKRETLDGNWNWSE